MKVKFKLETYDASATQIGEVISITGGTADSEDIDLALKYLLTLKEKRYNTGLVETKFGGGD